jgi:hypothetical protein
VINLLKKIISPNNRIRCKCVSKKKKKSQNRKNRRKTVFRNRRHVDNYKREHPCHICGETNSCCLSFHHNNGEKTGNISDMVSRGYGLKRIKEEIEKCDVLCLNCHSKLHNGEVRDD